MIAASVFLKHDGLKICIDAYDVCRVTETDTGATLVEYMPTGDKLDSFNTDTHIDKVLEVFAEAKRKAMGGGRPDPGDEWKGGGDDVF